MAKHINVLNQRYLFTPMTALKSRLTLALLNKRSQRKGLSKGFTLVELMIVIVIVGVLSAVALPNFLSQTGKAKGTEAKSQISAIMKNAAAEFQQGGIDDLNDLIGGAEDSGAQTDTSCNNIGGPVNFADDNTVETKFDYLCTTVNADETLTVVATANANDSSIENKMISQTMNLETGVISDNRADTCTIFGGTKTDEGCA